MAKVQHTCTGCVPIDASIIGVYVQLISANTRANSAAERAEHAAEYAIGKSPYIGQNGDWWEWDDEQAAFIDTGVQAQGQVAVDIDMSATSTNPVQNKVITEALGQKQATLVSGTNIKTVNGESILGGGNIVAGDPNAVKYVSQSLTDQQKTQARTNIGAYQKPASGIPASDIAPGVIPDISGKQDTISDLSTIRSGAALGATAYQKPGTGIPKTDMSSGVQSSLDLADSAVQAEPVGPILPPVETDEFATKTQVTQLQEQLNSTIYDQTTKKVISVPRANSFSSMRSTFVSGSFFASSSTTNVILFDVGANKKFRVKGTCSISTPVCGLTSGTTISDIDPTTKLYDSTEGDFDLVGKTTATQTCVAITVDKNTTYSCEIIEDIKDETEKLNKELIERTYIAIGTLTPANTVSSMRTTFTPNSCFAASDTTNVIIFEIGTNKYFKVKGTCSISTPVCGLVSSSSVLDVDPTTKLYDSNGGIFEFTAKTSNTQAFVAITVDKNTTYSCEVLGDLATYVETMDTRKRVDISTNDSEVEILTKLLDAFNIGKCDVYFVNGTYNFSNIYTYMRDTLGWSWTMELPIGNDCRYFFNGSTIISNAPDGEYSDSRNIFGCKAGASNKMNFELYDGVLINNGGTYCVHDECARGTAPYIHKYVNMRMYYVSGQTTEVGISKCIGGGCGTNGVVIIENCYFSTDTNDVDISWHGLTGDVDGIKFSLFINSCSFTKAPVVSIMKANDELFVKYSNNEQGQQPSFTTTPQNELCVYNNVTRGQ